MELKEYLNNHLVVNYDPYPIYNKEIYEILDSLGFDNDYLSKYEDIIDKDIKEMNLDDIRVMYSFILRGERFCDGHIASYIENGTLSKLLEREIELND